MIATEDRPPDTEHARPWARLLELAEAAPGEDLAAFARGLSAGEAARALAHLDPDEREIVLRALGAEESADLIDQLSWTQAADVFEHLEPADAADILKELPASSEAQILRDLDARDAEAVLAALPPDDAAGVRFLQAYPDDTAGGLMGTEFASVTVDATVEQIVEHLRQEADRFREFDVQYVYALDEGGGLRGVLPLRDLLLARRGARASSLMIADPYSVDVSAGLRELQEVFDRFSFFGLPVTDAGRLVGVVRRARVEEATGDEASRDHLKQAGIVGGEELRSMGLLVRARRRLQWLSINIGLNVLAASVLAIYQDTLSAVIALAVFLPIISDMSGCSGNQAVAVSMRELSLGVARPRDVLHVWGKEASVGVLNGIALGVLLGGVAWAWQGNPWLGLVAGSALAINTVLAVSIGGTVPLLLKGVGVDPALASGPVLTTITDLCGFLLVLALAQRLLPLLV